jgi:hypothetical protein
MIQYLLSLTQNLFQLFISNKNFIVLFFKKKLKKDIKIKL